MIWHQDQVICFVLLAIIRNSSETKPSIKANYSPKIINGEDTTIEKWPFLVQIVYKTVVICGGSTITNRWVLTAGHCILDTTVAHFKIYAGSAISYKGTTYDVESIKIHEHYKMLGVGAVADVALMQIKGEMRFSETLLAIKVDFAERQSDADYKNCSTAGWGRTNASIANGYMNYLNLQGLDVETVPHDDCKLTFPVLRSNVCVRSVNRPGAPCNGDSGGPLVCDGVLVGVVSFADDDCSGLTVYTKAASFYTWMKSYMKKFEKKFGQS